ncbi:MAG: hypothetical protein MJ151_03610 [Lachnospiraceae bacterium]|nr:hypothetical protein [Lachnospiraceae bacterium]
MILFSYASFMNAGAFEKEIKGSGLVVIKNTGHFSFVEDQYTYLKVMESYLIKRL